MDDAPLILGEKNIDLSALTEGDTTETPKLTLAPEQPYIAALEESMLHFDQSIATTQDMRRKILEKLLPSIESMEVETSFAADPDLFQAQSRFISEIRGLLNDIDTSAKTQVSVKLKKTDMDTQHQSSINAAEILAQLKLNNDILVKQVTAKNSTTLNEADIEKQIESRFIESGANIPETELEMGGSNLPAHNKEDE